MANLQNIAVLMQPLTFGIMEMAKKGVKGNLNALFRSSVKKNLQGRLTQPGPSRASAGPGVFYCTGPQ